MIIEAKQVNYIYLFLLLISHVKDPPFCSHFHAFTHNIKTKKSYPNKLLVILVNLMYMVQILKCDNGDVKGYI